MSVTFVSINVVIPNFFKRKFLFAFDNDIEFSIGYLFSFITFKNLVKNIVEGFIFERGK